MRILSIIVFVALTVGAGAQLWSHPATERYIPIGKSPGISNVKSYIGEIQSVVDTENGFLMSAKSASMQVETDESTMFYLDTGAGKTNKIGSEEDCRVGRLVEVYLHESGVAYWIKIKVP